MRKIWLGVALVALALGGLHPAAKASIWPSGTVEASTTLISPNGDGCKDGALVTASFSWPESWWRVSWYVEAMSSSNSVYIGSGSAFASVADQPPDSWSAPFPTGAPDGRYTLRLQLAVQLLDGQNTFATVDGSAPVTVDRRGPTLTATGPERRSVEHSTAVPGVGAVDINIGTGVGVASAVFADVSEDLDGPASVITVTALDGAPAAGTTSYDPAAKRLTYLPSTPLAGRYRAVALTTDLACNEGYESWDFVMVAPPTLGQ